MASLFGAMHVIFAGTSPALDAVTVYPLRDCQQREERVWWGCRGRTASGPTESTSSWLLSRQHLSLPLVYCETLDDGVVFQRRVLLVAGVHEGRKVFLPTIPLRRCLCPRLSLRGLDDVGTFLPTSGCRTRGTRTWKATSSSTVSHEARGRQKSTTQHSVWSRSSRIRGSAFATVPSHSLTSLQPVTQRLHVCSSKCRLAGIDGCMQGRSLPLDDGSSDFTLASQSATPA